MQKTVVWKNFLLGSQKVEECLWEVRKLQYINFLGNPIQEQNILNNTEEMEHEITSHQLPNFATRKAILLLTVSHTR